jgi:D-alanine-D-alanine ligase
VLHEFVGPGAPPEARDTLTQVVAVSDALARLGWTPVAMPCSLDLRHLERRLLALRPAAVFNLVEGLDGEGRLIAIVPELLDRLAIPYTGAPSEALLLSSNKIRTKERLRAAGLPTPTWWPAPAAAARSPLQVHSPAAEPEPGRYILKHVWEDASFGLDDAAIVTATDASSLGAALGPRAEGEWFAERYIEGRELNLSLLAAGGVAAQVLPPAEIVFDGFPPDKPRIVGYRAKWIEDSLEYRRTRRRFDFPAEDDALLGELAALARACWSLLGLEGYARVDFRIDADGQPWILEANANPCLSPDAGFSAAAAQAGLSFDEVVTRILVAARPRPRAPGATDGHRGDAEPRRT